MPNGRERAACSGRTAQCSPRRSLLRRTPSNCPSTPDCAPGRSCWSLAGRRTPAGAPPPRAPKQARRRNRSSTKGRASTGRCPRSPRPRGTRGTRGSRPPRRPRCPLPPRCGLPPRSPRRRKGRLAAQAQRKRAGAPESASTNASRHERRTAHHACGVGARTVLRTRHGMRSFPARARHGESGQSCPIVTKRRASGRKAVRMHPFRERMPSGTPAHNRPPSHCWSMPDQQALPPHRRSASGP